MPVALHHVVDGAGPRGNKPWVVLAHSLAADHTLVAAEARLLADRFHVLRFDIRGHGASPAPAAPYAMTALADDAGTLLDSLGITAAHWVGISLGGMIGMTLALARPNLLRGLVLADTTSAYPPAAHQSWRDRIAAVRAKGMSAVVDGTLARWFTPAFRERESERFAEIGAMIARTPVEGFVGCCEAIIGHDVTARLGEIGCPTLVIVGEQDEATPPAMAETLRRGIRGATLHIIPSAAHQSGVEQPTAFAALLEDFLARHT
jgi:3-oxoadipate enol-lactonase